MEPDTGTRLEEMDKKLDAIFRSTEKTRKYFLTMLIIGAVMFILPLIGLLFAIPTYLNMLNSLTAL